MISVEGAFDFKFFMAIISWTRCRRLPCRYGGRFVRSDYPTSAFTPDQFVSVTVAWSLLSSRQQTRAPTLKVLDWEPVIRFAVSVQGRRRHTSFLAGRFPR